MAGADTERLVPTTTYGDEVRTTAEDYRGTLETDPKESILLPALLLGKEKRRGHTMVHGTKQYPWRTSTQHRYY